MPFFKVCFTGVLNERGKVSGSNLGCESESGPEEAAEEELEASPSPADKSELFPLSMSSSFSDSISLALRACSKLQ